MSAWTDMGSGVHCAPTGVLYVDGQELGTVDEIQFTPDEPEDFGGKAIDTRMSRTFTIEMDVDYQMLRGRLSEPPKRPPDPDRPFWAVRPDRMRRNALRPTRRVK